MKNNKRGFKKVGLVIFFVLVLSVVLSSYVFASDDFEATLKKFPESYRPYLTALHEKHPSWVFEPFETGLDWNETVRSQYGEKSLVDNSASANIMKSHDADDYNPTTGSYVYKDGGFVQANEMAVEYFIDPRNFLNDEGIFQFERLNFSEIFSIEAVELILKKSFMYDTVITYLDAQGNEIVTDKKYSEVIYQAGKTYNINPCYLASKILNEVGTDGSYSVWGNHSTYPGIYNFYNIGATDGVNAITRGLAWANGGADGKLTTYSRPWNTPEKSIFGGAEFLASSYIAVGQFTGYLQRFNVNPDGSYAVHTHQYMTNLTGALSQGYSSYASYAKLGILDNRFVFSIPIFENMPQSDVDDSLVAVDSKLQYGTVNVAGVNVRTGPSTTYAKLQSSSGTNIVLGKGTEVRILSKHFVDSSYYSRILQYPIWYKISFVYNSQTYTGYIFYSYVDITTVTNVGVGNYDIGIFKSASDMGGKLFSDNQTVCKIVDDDTVKFLKTGKATVTVFNSRGKCERIAFNVCDDISSYSIKDMSVTSELNSISITLAKRTVSGRYGFYLADVNGAFVKGGDISSNTYTFKNLQDGSKYTVYCRYVNSHGYDNGPIVMYEISTKKKTAPDTPVNLSISEVTTEGYNLSWEKTSCDGYSVYRYIPETRTYICLGDTVATEFLINDLDPAYVCAYRVRAFNLYDGTKSYSKYSAALWAVTAPTSVQELYLSDITSDSISLSWSAVKGATSYEVYLDDKNGDKLIYSGAECSYNFVDAEPFTQYRFYVIAKVYKRGQTVLSLPSETATAVTKLATVDGFKASGVTFDSYKVSWNAIDNAAYYTVYQLIKGEYVKLTTTTEPYYTFDNLENSKKNFYKITATYDLDSALYESDFSKEFSATTLPDAVTGLKGKAYEDRINLTWNKVKNADCYNVYLYEGGKYVLKKTVKSNSYTLGGLADNTDYRVRVRAYIRSTLGTQKGKYCTYSFNTVIKTVTGLKASSVTDTSFTLSWNPSSVGVNRYNVYRYDNAKKGYVRIAYTKGATSVNLKGLEPGTTEKYCVVPYIMKNGSIYRRGYKSEGYFFSTRLGKTLNLRAENITADSFTLRWDKVENASYYRVYRYDTATKKYIQLGAPRTTYYEISSLDSGKRYYYKVRAIGRSDGRSYYGYYSDLLRVTTKK